MNQVQDYIAKARSEGKTDEQIKQSLLGAGWSENQLSELRLTLPADNNMDTPPPPPSFPPAGAWGRFWATAIDGLYIVLISLILYLPFLVISRSPVQGFGQIESDIRFGIIALLIDFIYTVYLTVNHGATFGKDAYGFKVVSFKSADNINYQQAFIRELLKLGTVLIPVVGGLFYFLNGLLIIFSKEKRGYHDLIAKTQVIKIKQPWSIGKQIIFILLPLIIVIGLLAYSTFQGINPTRQL